MDEEVEHFLLREIDARLSKVRRIKERQIDLRDFDKAAAARADELALINQRYVLSQLMKEMDRVFERFTDRARRVVVLAQEECRMLNHNYIGTEHILLGLIHEGEGVAAKVLVGLGQNLDGVRGEIEEVIGVGQQAPRGHIPFTPRAKKALELALREALQLGHNYIGTEHILLGLIREDEGVAAQVLVKRGVELTRVRQAIIQMLSGYSGKAWAEADTPDSPSSTTTNKIAAEAAECAEREREREERAAEGVRAVLSIEVPENTLGVVTQAWSLAPILVEHGVDPTPELLTRLIEWKAQ